MRGILVVVMALLLVSPTYAQAQSQSGVSRDYVLKLVEYMKKLNQRIKTLETQVKKGKGDSTSAASATADDGSIDLSKIEETPAAPPAANSQASYNPHAMTPGGGKSFRIYFDLNLISQPGYNGGPSLSFENFHSFLLMEASPMPALKFSFDINPVPNYYELEYQVSPRFSFRAGKIWIPFDQNNPHSMYGGRMNIVRLTNRPFLPNIWAELGVAAKLLIVESKNLTLDAQAFVTNGIDEGTDDPLVPGSAYPTFTTTSAGARDNNDAKAIGGRVTATFKRRYSLGASYYHSTWSTSGGLGLYMLGADGAIRFPKTELKLGFMTSSMDLPGSVSASRGGVYAEIMQKFGKNNGYRGGIRAGTLQPDDRVIDAGDQTLVGAIIGKNLGLMSVSLEHYVDLQDNAAKTSHHFTNLRMVVTM